MVSPCYLLTLMILINGLFLFGQQEISLCYFRQNENYFRQKVAPVISDQNRHNCIGINYQRKKSRKLLQIGLNYFRKENVYVSQYSSGGTPTIGFQAISKKARINYSYLGCQLSPLFQIFRFPKDWFQLYLGATLQLDFKTNEREHNHVTKEGWNGWGSQPAYTYSYKAFNAANVTPIYGLLGVQIRPRFEVRQFPIQIDLSCGFTSEKGRITDHNDYQQNDGQIGLFYRVGGSMVYQFKRQK